VSSAEGPKEGVDGVLDEEDEEDADDASEGFDEDFEDDEDDEDFDEDDEEDASEDFDEDDEDFAEDDEYEPGDVNAVDAVPYEPGDVNTIPKGAGRAPETDGTKRGAMPIAVLDYLARAMTDEPDAVVIRREERRGSTILRLHVAPRDMGRVIGRRGRTAQAIRALVAAAGARDGEQTVVDIVDD
jgi:predicted RNA-binding protein YlqC (UPF0109 family)